MFQELVTQLTRTVKVCPSCDYSPIWNSFKREMIIPECLSHNMKLKNIKLPDKLLDVIYLENVPEEFWHELFLVIRDSGCKNVQITTEQVVRIQCAGVEKELTLERLDENMLEDYENILRSQTSIPETMIFEEDKKILMENLKVSYQNTVKRKHDDEPEPVMMNVFLESAEAKRLQNIQSMEAEFYVQEKLLNIWKKFDIPLVILRGVKTYSNVGKHLSEFGIKLSKLR